MKNCVENSVRLKNPKNGLAGDYQGSRSAAIENFCISCMGGNRQDSVNCKSFTCNLWPYRPNGNKKPAPAGSIPSEKEYEELISKQVVSEARVAQGKKLGLMRKNK